MKRVLVVGAGVSGLTVAHELVTRGYAVTVIEAREEEELGGKSRSQYWEHPELGTLPGEHGYRFFPGFYHHLPSLMARIPLNTSTADPAAALEPYASSVADNLVPSEHMGIAYRDRNMIDIALQRPTLSTAPELARDLWESFIQVPATDIATIASRYIRFLSLCEERRDALDSISLWEYLGAGHLDADTQQLLMTVPRALVAMDAKQGNARTFLNTLFLMFNEPTSGKPHRVLNGPSSAAWLVPWYRWLVRIGVRFEFGKRVAGLEFDEPNKVIRSVHTQPTNGEAIAADHVVLAVPFECAQKLITADMRTHCGQCDNLSVSDANSVLATMTGAQLYMKEPLDVMKGHFSLPFSDWGLSGITQSEFWKEEHLPNGIGDVLSVCITNLSGTTWASAVPGNRRNREGIRIAVERQLSAARSPDGDPLFTSSNLAAFHLDRDLVVGDQGVIANHSRLLIHPPGFMPYRPKAKTEIGNFFLVGDYVANPIDLATMEGATYTALEAVNHILDRDGSTTPRCELRDVRAEQEPEWLKERKRLDRILWRAQREPLEALQPRTSELERMFDPKALEKWDAEFEASLQGGT